MASSQKTVRDAKPAAADATLAKALAPEDLRTGDYVTPLHIVAEVPSYWWCVDDWKLPMEEPVRMRFTSSCDGKPLRVKSLCLPFVLLKQPAGPAMTLDVRRYQLARLDGDYAKRAWKAYEKANSRKKGQPTA